MSWKINFISGGQSGTDRASLDFAIAKLISHGGWCPKGRLAEDTALDARYMLRETPEEGTLQRSEWNVRDANAVVIYSLGPKVFTEGTDALNFARKQKKPALHLHQGITERPRKLLDFLVKNKVRRVNIVGSKETEEPGINAWVRQELDATYDLVQSRQPAEYFNISAKMRRPGVG